MKTNDWNPVLKKFKEIKSMFVKTFGENLLWNYDSEDETCIEYWARMLNIAEYKDLLIPLDIMEDGYALLLRYTHSSHLFVVQRDIEQSGLDFWDIHDGFYSESRSVVIDIENDCLLMTPFRKFRNLGECENTSLEVIEEKIKKAKVVEFSNKMDGSMQCMRYYRDKLWLTGTESLSPKKSWRLKDGYDLASRNFGYQKMCKENPDKTFIFESITMKDVHVVKYTPEQEGLYLIGVRDVNTGVESSYKEVLEYAEKYNIPATKTFNTSLVDVLNNLDKKKSDEAEGFVLNIDGFKVKIKYDDYVKMHGILSTITAPNLVLKAIADNSYDDFLGKIPNAYRSLVHDVSNVAFEYVEKMHSLNNYYFEIAPKNDRKTFMIWIDKNIPKYFRGYVKNIYIGVENNYLKNNHGHYKYFTELKENLEYINNVLFQLKKENVENSNIEQEDNELSLDL